jgi:large subunit ribosomal protein L5
MLRLKDKYIKEIVPELKNKFGYKNNLAVPILKKVVINVGLGRAVSDNKIFDRIIKDLELITGQKPVKTYAKKSISGFKIRKGIPIGLSVTLRGKRMYDFLEKLINIVLPRVRDFRGIKPSAFDGFGNYSLGVLEHIVFPEINYEEVSEIYSLEINIVTNAKTNKEAIKLLSLLGFPFAEGGLNGS